MESESQSSVQDPGQYVLCHNWPNTPAIYGTTLQSIYARYGAAPLIAMAEWKKVDQAWPGARVWIEAFLALPEVKPAADQVREGQAVTKSRKRGARKCGNHAERERQAEWGFR